MAFVVQDDCIACGSCEGVCPVDALSMGDDIYEIDQDLCTECGDCVETCPTGSIIEE